MWNVRLDESQAGIKLSRRNINNLIYADDTTLMVESEEELKNFLRVKEKSEKASLKLSIQKIKIVASGPITSWQIGKKWKQWQILFSLAPKSLQMVIAAMKLKDACSLQGKLWQTFLLLFSHSAISDSLLPHGLQLARLPVLHHLQELAQTLVHWVNDTVKPSHTQTSPCPPAFSLSHHQCLFQWVSSSHQLAKVLELQVQYQSFQWIFSINFL